MSLPSAVLFCPGRGSYGRAELGSIARALRLLPADDPLHGVLRLADDTRRGQGLPTISELDAASSFRPGLHLDGIHAAELIWFATVAHCALLQTRYDIVAVAGNSLGWYSALPVAGAVDVEDGWRLVTTMARLQRLARGAQLLTTTVDPESWLPDAALVRGVEDALAVVSAGGERNFVARSIRLGGHEVLAGTEDGVRALLALLPGVRSAERAFPFQLAGHGPFHTALCEPVATAASAALADLPIRAPRQHLIDGRGDQHAPWSADPVALLDYTTTTQVLTTFDFTAAVRTAIREFCPDLLVCAGPGTSLRAPVGHVVLREGYRGIRSRDRLFDSGLVAID